MNIVIWGYGFIGTLAFNKLRTNPDYKIVGFADNSTELQKFYVNGHKIMSLEECKKKLSEIDYSVIIAAVKWYEIGLQLEEANIPICGVFADGKIQKYEQAHFDDLTGRSEIKLYAGDICDDVNLNDPNLYGLSVCKGDKKHIYHDITRKMPLTDNSISSYVAEHVLEHIDYGLLPKIINEIYRVLKNGARLRICLPDYNSPWLKQLSMCDKEGNILYDASGGGKYRNNQVVEGHVWFPTYDKVRECLDKTLFKNIEFIRYRNQDESIFSKPFDNSKEYLYRTEIDYGSNDYNLIVDCIK